MELKSTKTCPVCHKQALIYGFKKFHCTSCNAYQRSSNLGERFRVWCIGKNWIWRAIVFLAFSYIFWRIYNTPDSTIFGYSIPIGFHKYGNLVEVVIPIMILLGSLILYYYFAAVIASIWLAGNILDISNRTDLVNPYLSTENLRAAAAIISMLGLASGIYMITCMIWANRKSVQA